ncbi:Peptidoglycan glycosyltransferase FtsW [Symmachiella dynata]|uniref:Probable peptidoglycan glycosyltransferase FtsW n=1 Tax=Symmachiella dynata TaxID=2527995 RepID=A0A517ZWV7_9PLAN|nr:Peptidoglycan glycosyltransferase FtsW [Symmachiella dynata]
MKETSHTVSQSRPGLSGSGSLQWNVQPVNNDRGFFLALIGMLLAMGVLMVHSASMTSHPSQSEQIYLSRHLLFLACGIAAGIIASQLPAQFIYRAAPFLFAVVTGLLVLVLIPGIGTHVNGAQRWLRLGTFTMQPAELAKLALPLFLARLVMQVRARETGWWTGFLLPCLPAAVMVPLVMRQPDLGTALFLAAGSGILLFVARWPLRNFALIAAPTIPAIAYLVIHRPYQMQRISGFVAAWTDPSSAPYQLKQSLMTLGAGGGQGVGLGKGWQKLSFLPEANTDFVFAVIGEELGLIGTFSVVALWIGVYIFGIRLLARHDKNSFAFLAGTTLLTQIILQAAINVAVVTAMVPPKGIPHPLMSYGGSNLVTTLMAIGLIVSFSRATESVEATAVDDSDVETPQSLAA